MKKFYKNLTGKLLKFEYNGKVLEIPANAKSIELDESVANTLQGRTPVKILEEVEKTENPVVQETEEDLEEYLKKDLQKMCDDMNIDYVERDTKKDLIDKIRGE
jgi:hypothetical protein